jgi:4-hydroxy-tetrahydrodipicolinate reductase
VPPTLAIIGLGQMGRAVAALAEERGWPVVATLTAADGPVTAERLHGAQVAIEFTQPAAAADTVRACAAAGCPVVSGTTGWLDALPAVGADVTRAGTALLWSANFSVGANALAAGAAWMAGRLRGAAFDARIIETHHAGKRDAPSGTALGIQRAMSRGPDGLVPITSIRLGAVPGVHEVVFDGAYEQLRLVHEVRDRRVFADGALLAAAWLIGRRGVFTLDDMLADPGTR